VRFGSIAVAVRAVLYQLGLIDASGEPTGGSGSIDPGDYARGGMIRRGADDFEALAAGAQNTLLRMGADDPAWSTLSSLLDAVIGSSAGTMLFRGSMSWTARGIGAVGRVLASSGGEPTWTVLSDLETVDPSLAGGRLSVDVSDPVGEGTSATLRYLPYTSDTIAIYDGTAWRRREFTAPALDVSALTADQVYDVFAAFGGSLVLEAVAWSDHGAGTGARATAIVRQDGVWVKSGDATRRLLGSIRTVDSSGVKARDAAQFRYVWNVANRVPYRDTSHDSTDSWSSSGTNLTWAARNGGNAAWVHRWVHGLAQSVRADGAIGVATSGGADAYSGGPALNWTSGAPASTTLRSVSASQTGATPESYAGTPPIGYGYVQCVETSSGSGTAPTIRGDAGGSFWGSGMIVEGER
jgi:hypothetical protein